VLVRDRPFESIWDDELSPAQNLERDEDLLRSARPVVRVGVLNAPAVSLGIGQSIEAEAAARSRALGLPVLRRSSGGTGLLHLPGDLAWSLVLPRSHPWVGRDFPRAYERLGEGTVRFLTALRLPAAWVEAPGLSTDFCLLSSRGRVLTARSRIVGGAAQHATAYALLHQGVVSYRVNSPTLEYVFRTDPGVIAARLTGLVDELGHRPPRELGRRLLSALQESLALGSPTPAVSESRVPADPAG
jgi:lipoate-protein ligase A